MFLRALGLRGADEIIRASTASTSCYLKSGTIYWAVADSLVGLRAAKDIVVPGENFTVQQGKKITKNAVEALKRANVEAVEIPTPSSKARSRRPTSSIRRPAK